jgi:hypothetical protein
MLLVALELMREIGVADSEMVEIRSRWNDLHEQYMIHRKNFSQIEAEHGWDKVKEE